MKKNKQFIIIIDGPMGSGKTTIGNLIHKKLKRTALLSGDRIKWFISDFKRNLEDNAIISAVMLQMCKEYIKQRINIIIAQGFWKEEYMLPFIKMAKRNKVRFFVYQLTAPKDILLKRVSQRQKPTKAKFPVSGSRALKNLKSWEKYGYRSEKIFDTSKLSPKYIAKQIIEEIEREGCPVNLMR